MRGDGGGRAPHRDVGAVGQRHHGDQLVGLGAIQGVREQEPGLCCSRAADGRRQVAALGLRLHAGRGRDALGRAGVRSGHHQSVERLRDDAGLLQRRGQRALREWNVGVLAEALLPLA